jgi:hypothetical protein
MSPFSIRPPSELMSLDGSGGLGDRPWPPISLRQRRRLHWFFTSVRFQVVHRYTAPHFGLEDLHTSL